MSEGILERSDLSQIISSASISALEHWSTWPSANVTYTVSTNIRLPLYIKTLWGSSSGAHIGTAVKIETAGTTVVTGPMYLGTINMTVTITGSTLQISFPQAASYSCGCIYAY